MKLEIACFNAESAKIAAHAGADRIELCADYTLGGISPDITLLKKLKEEFKTPVFTMIRPRGGDFVYSDEEFEKMKRSLVEYRKAGADGFVFGMLTREVTIDVERSRELIELAAGKPCTFHRAFDPIKNKEAALEELITLGFRTVLTSGGEHPAIVGKQTLQELNDQSRGRITILAGGGIRAANVHHFKALDFVHSACVDPETGELDRHELSKLRARVAQF